MLLRNAYSLLKHLLLTNEIDVLYERVSDRPHIMYVQPVQNYAEQTQLNSRGGPRTVSLPAPVHSHSSHQREQNNHTTHSTKQNKFVPSEGRTHSSFGVRLCGSTYSSA